MLNEIWKDITGYEGEYQVSNTGRVRSLDRCRLVKNRYGRMSYRTDKGREMVQMDNGHGYLIVSLRNGHRKNHYVHRLVADAFCERADKSVTVVNHKDYNRANNHADNLEFVTAKENIMHSRERMRHPHKSGKASNTGEKYISITTNHGKQVFRVFIRQIGVCKQFHSLADAVAYRNEVMRTW